jgi:ankyrin repeat protein
MHISSRIRIAAGVLTLLSLSLPACHKRGKDQVKAELLEAGYQFSDADWFKSARQNDVSALKKFSAAKFPATTRTTAGDSALHESASSGAEAAADYLLKCGIPIDARGSGERTPLMSAIAHDQTAMVRWLLRQGADSKLKDAEGFSPLMLAVHQGYAGSVTELAARNREDLDPALLLAALIGKEGVIDSLTSFGASVHTRMEDGRTPLMIAVENGHTACVSLLLDLGSSRLATDANGRSAAEMATAAGFPEIAALLEREPLPGELALESPAELAMAMDQSAEPTTILPNEPRPSPRRLPTRSIAGATVSKPILTAASPSLAGSSAAAARSTSPPDEPALPPLVMRGFRERQVPLVVKSVQGETATLTLPGKPARQLSVRAGDSIPNTPLTVVRVQRRMEMSKVNPDGSSERSTVQMRDTRSGVIREWISGVPATAHDPSALVEDSATGQRYIAAPGEKFTDADGTSYVISDVRPNQLVIQNSATGTVRTIPLRGPRG